MTREKLEEIKDLLLPRFPTAVWHAALVKQMPSLIEALEEAGARCETLQLIADAKSHDAGVYARRMEEAQKARSAALAEAARWKEHLRHIAYEHCDSPVHYAMNQLEEG